jgi:hypothetical protein
MFTWAWRVLRRTTRIPKLDGGSRDSGALPSGHRRRQVAVAFAPALPVIAGARSSPASAMPALPVVTGAGQAVVGTSLAPFLPSSRASLSVIAGEPSHLGLSRFPFCPNFPPTPFVPNTHHLPCRRVKLVRTRYICLARLSNIATMSTAWKTGKRKSKHVVPTVVPRGLDRLSVIPRGGGLDGVSRIPRGS